MTVEGDDAGEPATPSLGEPPAEARSIVDEILGDLTEFGRTAAPGSDVERVDKSGEPLPETDRMQAWGNGPVTGSSDDNEQFGRRPEKQGTIAVKRPFGLTTGGLMGIDRSNYRGRSWKF
ncbi:hypothetical protein C6341_g6993 [Phytophthora cactorum]|nr:hypothetical protein C6341_g6993 [Phytophthora cactorum]